MKKLTSYFALLCCSAAVTFAQTSDTSSGPITHGLRVFTVGHSFHSWVGQILLEMAKAAGMNDARMNVTYLGGSTVLECWQIPNLPNLPNLPNRPKPQAVNTAKAALTSGSVDVLTLSPIWMPDEGIDDFAAFAYQHNPNIRVTVQEFWLPNDTYEPKYPLEVNKKPTVDHNAATMPELQKHYEDYNRDVEAYVAGVNKKLGKQVVYIVPVGMATLALREKIVAGQCPGIEKQSELYRDPWGHPQLPLQVLSGYCHYAVIYRRSPVGLPMPVELQGKYANPELNKLLQQLAWDAVSQHPMTGVTASDTPATAAK